jgi:hypothetical protein
LHCNTIIAIYEACRFESSWVQRIVQSSFHYLRHSGSQCPGVALAVNVPECVQFARLSADALPPVIATAIGVLDRHIVPNPGLTRYPPGRAAPVPHPEFDNLCNPGRAVPLFQISLWSDSTGLSSGEWLVGVATNRVAAVRRIA